MGQIVMGWRLSSWHFCRGAVSASRWILFLAGGGRVLAANQGRRAGRDASAHPPETVFRTADSTSLCRQEQSPIILPAAATAAGSLLRLRSRGSRSGRELVNVSNLPSMSLITGVETKRLRQSASLENDSDVVTYIVWNDLGSSCLFHYHLAKRKPSLLQQPETSRTTDQLQDYNTTVRLQTCFLGTHHQRRRPLDSQAGLVKRNK